jgi:hypothetical protein
MESAANVEERKEIQALYEETMFEIEITQHGSFLNARLTPASALLKEFAVTKVY